MFEKIKWWLIIGFLSITSYSALAQVTTDPPEVEFEIPFDFAAVIAGVLALAVVVLLTTAGPKISLQFGKKALKMAAGIFR